MELTKKPVMLKDKQGLPYIKDNEILKRHYLSVDEREIDEDRYDQYCFLALPETDDYMVKFSVTFYTRKEIKGIKEMLAMLIEKQKYINSVDFPIGYLEYYKRLSGLIIRYYKNSKSLDNIIKSKKIDDLKEYFNHDEDSIRNLFILFELVLDVEYEMFENGIYYRDFNPGNIMLYQNTPKIIDFDYIFINFKNKDFEIKRIMESYRRLLDEVLSVYGLMESVDFEGMKDFEGAKVYTKKLENYVRKK